MLLLGESRYPLDPSREIMDLKLCNCTLTKFEIKQGDRAILKEELPRSYSLQLSLKVLFIHFSSKIFKFDFLAETKIEKSFNKNSANRYIKVSESCNRAYIYIFWIHPNRFLVPPRLCFYIVAV